MKLRLRGDTLRLRLTRSEVEQIGAGRSVEEQTRFPDGSSLTYRLVAGEQDQAGVASGDTGQVMTIEVAADAAARWAASEVVGLHGDEPVQIGPLTVLIEKDFTCVTPRAGEEELDTYPNPNVAAG